MGEEGDLHLPEEFGRAKRNLIWFCSFAILLWIIHVPTSGDLDPPILGTSARIDVNILRVAVWSSCVYCLIGFYRELRNAERVNSQTIYSRDHEGITKGLNKLRIEIDSLCNEAAKIRRQISASGDEAGRVNSDAKQGPPVDTQEGDELTRLARSGMEVGFAIRNIRADLNRLSEGIRMDHRLMFVWYDKYLSYSMFTAASLATALGVGGSLYYSSEELVGASLSLIVTIVLISFMFLVIVALAVWVIRASE